jgi:hypothetical protein
VTVVALAIEGVLIPNSSGGKIEVDISAVSKTSSEEE